jgi:hypothetical protein
VAILRRHLIDKVPVCTLCGEQHAHPTLFYRWLKEFFERVAQSLGSSESLRLLAFCIHGI